MDSTEIVLSILEETYIIHKLAQSTKLPEELIECEFYSLSNSQEELSLELFQVFPSSHSVHIPYILTIVD